MNVQRALAKQVCLPFQPYVLMRVKDEAEAECEQYLRRKFEGKLANCERIEKEDLDKKNHLVGLTQTFVLPLALFYYD
jgi:DNA polymerase epsilon subunit 1